MEETKAAPFKNVLELKGPNCVVVYMPQKLERSNSLMKGSRDLDLPENPRFCTPSSKFSCSSKKKPTIAEIDNSNEDEAFVFDDIFLLKRERFYNDLQSSTSDVSKVMLRQSKKIMFFWRGTNLLFPYAFKKCERREMVNSENIAVDVSVDLSNKKIDRSR